MRLAFLFHMAASNRISEQCRATLRWIVLNCLIGSLSTVPFVASAKTLIVTHPEIKFDQTMSAGSATRALLLEKSIDRKVVLRSPGGQEPMTFKSTDLVFDWVDSKGGEFVWDNRDDNITLAGGHLFACMGVTLQNLVQFSQRDLNIEIAMPATYSGRSSLQFNAGLEIIKPEHQAMSLSNFERRYGTKKMKVIVEKVAAELFRVLEYSGYVHDPISNADFTVSGRLAGVPVATYGHGRHIIILNFVR